MPDTQSVVANVGHSPHSALIARDLLQLYFKLLSNHELTVAARVCTTWTYVAEDELWRTREVPLNGLLSKLKGLKLLRKDGDANVIPLWNLPRDKNSEAILMGEWKQLVDNYAHRVTRLHITDDMPYPVPILLKKYGGSLCPNVVCLRLSSKNDSWIGSKTLAMALGPSVTDLTMEGYSSGQVELLARVGVITAPQIKRLVFRSPFKYSKDPLTINCGIFRNLRITRLADLSWRGWKMLASCERLEEVTLASTTRWIERESISTDQGDRPTFPSLRQLRIGDRGILEEVLRESVMPALEYLTLDTFMNLAATKVTSLSVVGRRSPLLKGLTIRDASGAFKDVVEGMSSMRNLISINISGTIYPDQLNFDNIKDIATRHRNLEVFILKPKIRSDLNGGMTINSLLSLTQYCAALRRVELPLDLYDFARDTSDVAFQALMGAPSMTITKMAIRFVVGLTNAARAAESLAKLLPNVEELDLRDRLVPVGERKEMIQLVEEFRMYRASQHLLRDATQLKLE
ncbi:hypothetical protein FRB97_008831 [Tulasnella sp. 331]|nr:hypothetical protein FRB97_008831 [Tulasnella sp. 331]